MGLGQLHTGLRVHTTPHQHRLPDTPSALSTSHPSLLHSTLTVLSPAVCVQEYDWGLDQISKLLPSGLPAKIFQGGGFCCPSFQSKMADWAIPRSPRFSSLSFHRYVWNGCGDNPTLDSFLSDYAGLAGLQKPLVGNITLASSIAKIHANTNPPLPVYLGEGNSVGCEGMGGITDTFAQVVWLLDYTLALASFNVSGMHFYIGWTNPNDFLATPFIYPHYAEDSVSVKPMMYGMWMFAFATWNHARIVPNTRAVGGGGVVVAASLDLVKLWTLVDADDNVVVVMVRKDHNGTNPVDVVVLVEVKDGAASYAASVVVCSAPSMTAMTGITMAGMTWDGTTNGVPRQVKGGQDGFESTRIAAQERRSMRADGTEVKQLAYPVTLASSSAAVLVIPTNAGGGASWQQRVQSILQVKPPSASTI